MDERLQLQILRAVVADLRDLGQGQFAGQHNALGSQLVADLRGLIVRDACLGRDMTLDLRGILFGQRQHTQIGNDERIHARLGGILNVPGQLGKFLVRGQGVQRQIDLFAAGMGKDAALVQFAHSQVDGCGAHAKFRQGAVDGICAVHDGVFQRFQAARGGQQFRLLQHSDFLRFA